MLIDWAQNDPRRSTVAPYSLRAANQPLVSAPVTWDEVAGDPEALWFDAGEVAERVKGLGDVFAPALSPAASARSSSPSPRTSTRSAPR